jgi:hypothetical protein
MVLEIKNFECCCDWQDNFYLIMKQFISVHYRSEKIREKYMGNARLRELNLKNLKICNSGDHTQ